MRRRPVQTADVAEKMIRRLRVGMMPPPGAKRPAGPRCRDSPPRSKPPRSAGRANPNPGRRPFQRLNRAEYRALDPRSPRPRHRRHRVPAARHGQRRVRQRRRRAGAVGDVDGGLPARGGPDQPRSPSAIATASADRGDLPRAAHRVADAARRGRADRHARRGFGRPYLSRPTASTASAMMLHSIERRSSSAAPRAASSSRSRSTANASRSSTSIRACPKRTRTA